ncbi:MAG: methyl-accepting chemotaxis protein [Bacteroidales bacterium]|nr:methyl-accepting chemotaxis protein [Bacteroidales bacterium]
MKSSIRISSRLKLLAGFILILVSIIAIQVINFIGIGKIKRSQNDLINAFQTSQSMLSLRNEENRIRALTLEMILTHDQEERDAHVMDIRRRIGVVEETITNIEKNIANNPENLEKFSEIKELLKTFRANRERQLIMINQGKKDEALDFALTVQNPFYESIQSKMGDMDRILENNTKEVLARNDALNARIAASLGILGSLIIVISLLFIIWTFRLLHNLSREVKAGVNILGTSAAEILTTVNEVSTGATETATAVSETTTTIEEIRQTALLATQRAQMVLDSSRKASEAADNGKESVQQTIEGMDRINQQMNLIAESVVKLSEQNRSIGEITASVNDIADQSNLLAVNAAIEAAKAGEQGRGFAVVAQEIRSLAEQSKQATSQVKEILTEIQKAVNLAVMATEQGSKAVDHGNKLARQSGEMIDILAESVNDAVQSVIQISTSSQQQMAGMDQIVPAMENIKQASEQNVVGTRQTQNAAQTLNELGQNLKKIILKYNV